MRKETYNLNQTLDSIWRMGDRDEMSAKHIGHALAAIVTYDDWTQGDDYNLPDCCWTEDERINAWRAERLTNALKPKWAKVQALKDRLGKEEFLTVVSDSKFGFLCNSYLESSWLSYADHQLQSA